MFSIENSSNSHTDTFTVSPKNIQMHYKVSKEMTENIILVLLCGVFVLHNVCNFRTLHYAHKFIDKV